MSQYDYFVAGRWRNHQEIQKVVAALRQAGKSVYCFIENSYNGDGIDLNAEKRDAESFMQELESLEDWRTNPTFKKIFETDMQAERQAEAFIMVFPAGLAAHMELGAAYGMGKKCYAIGQPDKAETLYLMFDEIYPNVDNFLAAEVGARV